MVDVAEVGEDALAVHDAHREDPSHAFALAHLAERPVGPTPIGILRAVQRPAYGSGRNRKLTEAHANASLADVDDLCTADTWNFD